MTILGTGLTGLIGSRVVELLRSTYSFENMSRSTGVDIANFSDVQKKVAASPADVLIHFAGYTDVKKAEVEKDLGDKSEAWMINVLGTENVAKSAKEFGKKLIYISTDMVFDGEHTPEGGYREKDAPHPLSWYAKTKYEGELRINDITPDAVILRIAYPYRANFSKLDFVRLFIQKLERQEPLTVLSDRIITPTFIDDIAGALDALIQKNVSGIYHAVGNETLSIYDCAQKIAEVFALDRKYISPVTREEFLVGKPPEPFNSSLNNGKIKSLGVTMHGFVEGLKEIKKQKNG